MCVAAADVVFVLLLVQTAGHEISPIPAFKPKDDFCSLLAQDIDAQQKIESVYTYNNFGGRKH